MLVALALLSVVGAGPPAEIVASPTDATEAAVSRSHAIVLDARLADASAIEEALALRLMGRSIEAARPPFIAPDRAHAWVTASEVGPEALTLRIIVSDGRLFERRLQAAPDQRARVVAGAVANMIDAIEHNRLAPEQTGVEAPSTKAVPSESEPEAAAMHPEAGPPAEDAPEVSPPAPEPIDEAPPRWSLGSAVGPAITLGLGPPTGSGAVTGMGAQLAVSALHVGGLAAWLDIRAVSWRDEVRVTQVRFAPALAHAWRPGRFELWGVVGPTISAVRIGAPLVDGTGSPRPAAPLIGGRAALRPALVLYRRDQLRLVLGLEVEASVAAEARAPLGAIAVTRRDGTQLRPIARAGGFELAAALTLELRLGLR